MKLKISTKVARQLKKMKNNPALAQRLRAALLEIAADPYQGKALDGVYLGVRSWRVGDWRILYRIYRKKLEVLVLEIGDRKDIY
ncbi:MAG TPA: type II toxin-antitoxin system mRNA interferase toxin, RelE/StbE family [Bacteroidetes bacterium]|nr:type II toxin-antitoxin system mRNA interferase toxin, RelE/StbE family [Bacteroidota bacterium]